MFGVCIETVSILYAMVFGTDGACVDVGIVSILTAFGAFMVLVVIAQALVRRFWKTLIKPRTVAQAPEAEPKHDTPYSDDPNYRDSAIRSSKR